LRIIRTDRLNRKILQICKLHVRQPQLLSYASRFFVASYVRSSPFVTMPENVDIKATCSIRCQTSSAGKRVGKYRRI